jgi:membrane protein
MNDKRSLAERVRARVRSIEERAAQSVRKRVRFPLMVWRIGVQVVRQWQRDRCPQQAASLSFQTVLSLVPALAVGMASFRAMGMLREESTLVDFLARELIPLSREEIAGHLLKWSENVTFESLGLVGLFSIVPIAFLVFNNLEQSVNHIWRVERKRRLYKRLLVFYATATVGPLIFGWSLVQAAHFGLTQGISGAFLSVLSTFVGLLLANLLLPATPVRLLPAIGGALVTTILAEIAKFAFGAYVSSYALDRYIGIYGAVAAIPLWLVWIYWSWVMFLLGVEIAHALQHIKVLEHFTRQDPVALEREITSHANAATALRVCAHLAQHPSVNRGALASRFNLSREATSILIRRLSAEGLVERQGTSVSLSRAPSEIQVDEVLDVFRFDASVGPEDESEAVSKFLSDLSESRAALSHNRTLADLVASSSAGPGVDGPADGKEAISDQSKADDSSDPDGLVSK